MMKVGHDRDLELRRGPGGSQQVRPRQGLPDGAGGERGGRDQEICQAINDQEICQDINVKKYVKQ